MAIQPNNICLRLESDIVLLMALKSITIVVIMQGMYHGQCTVSRCTETPLRQYITTLYETK